MNEALVSNVILRNSILTKDMKLKIDNGESPIISQEKMYETPTQLTLKLEEKKQRTNHVPQNNFYEKKQTHKIIIISELRVCLAISCPSCASWFKLG